MRKVTTDHVTQCDVCWKNIEPKGIVYLKDCGTRGVRTYCQTCKELERYKK